MKKIINIHHKIVVYDTKILETLHCNCSLILTDILEQKILNLISFRKFLTQFIFSTAMYAYSMYLYTG